MLEVQSNPPHHTVGYKSINKMKHKKSSHDIGHVDKRGLYFCERCDYEDWCEKYPEEAKKLR